MNERWKSQQKRAPPVLDLDRPHFPRRRCKSKETSHGAPQVGCLSVSIPPLHRIGQYSRGLFSLQKIISPFVRKETRCQEKKGQTTAPAIPQWLQWQCTLHSAYDTLLTHKTSSAVLCCAVRGPGLKASCIAFAKKKGFLHWGLAPAGFYPA
jgi:hypothetical protein